jgi:hypothetical protein
VLASPSRFILLRPTVALGFDQSGKRVIFTIPAGAEITATDVVPLEPTLDRSEQIDVKWQDQALAMFLIDLQDRGRPVRSV